MPFQKNSQARSRVLRLFHTQWQGLETSPHQKRRIWIEAHTCVCRERERGREGERERERKRERKREREGERTRERKRRDMSEERE